MQKLSLIAAIDEEYGIGKDNQLLCHLPADLAHFKRTTLGKPIIMGYKTYLSIGKPLPGRKNIVLSRKVRDIPGVFLATSLNEALNLAQEAEELMIIGGEQVFKEAFPLATDLYLTLIHHRFEADVFFPSFHLEEWLLVSEETFSADEKNPYDLNFLHYQRKVDL